MFSHIFLTLFVSILSIILVGSPGVIGIMREMFGRGHVDKPHLASKIDDLPKT